MFTLESPHRGGCDKYAQHTIINIKRKLSEIIPNTIMSAMGFSFFFFFLIGTRERVRNSRSKRAISVRATEVLLYLGFNG